MENEKKNNGIFVGILIGIIIMVVVGVALFVTGTIGFKTNINNDNVQSNGNNQSSENTSKSIKLDDSKDYIYDAEYKYNNKYTENGRDTEKRTISYFGIPVEVSGNIKDLKVPYINIRSDAAKYANNELENLYMDYAKEFDSCAEDMKTDNGGNGIGCSQILTYRTYKYNNVLSVVVIDSETGTTPFVFKYHIYNFNLSDGTLINFDNMLSLLGYNKETAVNDIKKIIKDRMNEEFKGVPENDLSKACIYNGKSTYGTDNCYDITYLLLDRTINDNSILFFADNGGNLNILPIFYIDFVENGGRNHYLVKSTTK